MGYDIMLSYPCFSTENLGLKVCCRMLMFLLPHGQIDMFISMSNHVHAISCLMFSVTHTEQEVGNLSLCSYFKMLYIFITNAIYRFGHVYNNLQPRVTRTLLHAFLDPTKALPQHYGAIQGLSALGPSVVSSF